MKTSITIAAILALFLFPVRLSAQYDEREPGIYAIVDGESIPLGYTYGGMSTGELNDDENLFYRYRGETSGVNAGYFLVYVIDPTLKSTYNSFNKWMNPNSLIILPLTVNHEKQRREYGSDHIGLREEEMIADDERTVNFDWKRISDNSFEICVPGISPGEYGIVLRKGKLGQFNYSKIYCFTIPEHSEE